MGTIREFTSVSETKRLEVGAVTNCQNEPCGSNYPAGYSHRRNRGGRTGVSREGREGGLRARLLDISTGLASREVRADAGRERRRLGDDLRAVDERALVDAEQTEAAEHVRERLLELLLVVRERLPLARRA